MSTYECQKCGHQWDGSSFFGGVKADGCPECGSNIIDRIERPKFTPKAVPEEVELEDQWGETLADMESRYKRSFSDVERHVILNVHSHSSCATGIWIEGELDDIVSMVLDYAASTRQATIKEVVERLKRELGNNEQYIDLDYSKYQNDDDTSWSKRQIKESRKQRMARVVTRNEFRKECRAALKKIEEEMV